jgi:hypothetical protein
VTHSRRWRHGECSYEIAVRIGSGGIAGHNTRENALASMIVATWAVAHGYQSRWSANRFCWEVSG